MIATGDFKRNSQEISLESLSHRRFLSGSEIALYSHKRFPSVIVTGGFRVKVTCDSRGRFPNQNHYPAFYISLEADGGRRTASGENAALCRHLRAEGAGCT